MTRYVVVTPVRDEEEYVAATIECVIRQTVRPVEWIIVDDGSSDRTGEIIDGYAERVSWIRIVHRQNRGFRKAGAGVVEAFYDGYKQFRCHDWNFIVKLDGDLSFSPEYFEQCFAHFQREPKLGIGGGDIYHQLAGNLKLESNPRFHVRGATKIYRRACWEAIEGLFPAAGWDTIDEVKANMLGWKTYSFPELQLLHHRLTGTSQPLWRDQVKHGSVCYVAGYHPLFVAASCLRRISKKPYVVGSLAMLLGFVKGYCAHQGRMKDAQFVKYLRRQQLRRLCGLDTIWK